MARGRGEKRADLYRKREKKRGGKGDAGIALQKRGGSQFSYLERGLEEGGKKEKGKVTPRIAFISANQRREKKKGKADNKGRVLLCLKKWKTSYKKGEGKEARSAKTKQRPLKSSRAERKGGGGGRAGITPFTDIGKKGKKNTPLRCRLPKGIKGKKEGRGARSYQSEEGGGRGKKGFHSPLNWGKRNREKKKEGKDRDSRPVASKKERRPL